MRAYSIVVTNPNTGALVTTVSSPPSGATYASFANGVNLPGALNIELDVPAAAFATPGGDAGAFVKIWGVSIAEILQAADLNGMFVQVYAGMMKGLPLAKPAQYGLIIEGTINQAFGNWVGTEMSLDWVVVADMGSADAPKNIILNWVQGQTLQSALQATLATAFPSAKVKFAISGNLVAPESIVGYYATVEELARDVLAASRYVINDPNYLGVQIFQQQGSFSIYDGTSPTAPKPIAFEDLIGQPTWIDQGVVQFKTVLRADFIVGDFVSFPKVLATTSAASAPPFGSGLKNKSSFDGTFQLTDVHHYGDFRQSDAAAWNTTFNATSAEAQVNAANAPVGT